jgi:hypothetical protein
VAARSRYPPPALASATHPARCFQGDVNDPDTYKKNVILRTNKVPFKLPFLLPFLFSTFLLSYYCEALFLL